MTRISAFPVCYLNRVEPAVAIEGKADDMRWILVPAGVDWVTHYVSGLREDLLDEDLLPAQGNSLTQVGRDAYHQTVAWLCHPSLLTLLLPTLQLLDHGSQLVISCLLIQQLEVLEHGGKCTEFASVLWVITDCEFHNIAVYYQGHQNKSLWCTAEGIFTGYLDGFPMATNGQLSLSTTLNLQLYQ